jgi:hypothetical protein
MSCISAVGLGTEYLLYLSNYLYYYWNKQESILRVPLCVNCLFRFTCLSLVRLAGYDSKLIPKRCGSYSWIVIPLTQRDDRTEILV